MYVVKVCGYWGECFVGKNDEPCFKQKNALLFKTRQAGATYIMKHFKQWENVTNKTSTMTVKEV